MTVAITTDGRSILAKCDYDENDRVKQVTGTRGGRDGAGNFVWRAPLSVANCLKFRELFGPELHIGNALADWYRAESALSDELEQYREGDPEAAAARLDRVRDVAPELFKAISSRTYQLDGAAFMVGAGAALLGDQPGLGKTLQALAALIQADAGDILVSCPRTAMVNVWASETARWWPDCQVFVAQGDRAAREHVFQQFAASSPDRPAMLIINTEMIRMVKERCPEFGTDLKKCKREQLKRERLEPGSTAGHKHDKDVAEWPFLFADDWDAIVVDESHNLLASTAHQVSKRITQGRYGAVKLRRRIRPDGIVIALSGTPARSHVEKFWGTLNWLDPKTFSSFWRFAEEHFGVVQGRWGNVVGHTDPETGNIVVEPRDEIAWRRALAPVYLARTKELAAPDLPPIFYAGTPPQGKPQGQSGVWIDMTPVQARAYRDMQDWGVATVSGSRIAAVGVLAELTRLRQLASSTCEVNEREGEPDELLPALPSPKVDWVMEFLRERQGNAGKVVIASSFTKMVNLLAGEINREFPGSVLTLTGETSDRERTALVKNFQDPADQHWIVVLNTRAGGEAITLDAADDMIFMDLPWTDSEVTQAEARIHRVSRIHNVTVYRLLTRGTVDEWIAGLNAEQRRILAGANVRKLSELALEGMRFGK